MAAQQQSLCQWVAQINDTLFIQPDDEIALKAVDEQVDPSLVVRYITPGLCIMTGASVSAKHRRINQNIYNYHQFKEGLQYARSSTTSIQDEFSVLLHWENAEKGDGVIAVLSKWMTKDKTTGKETKRTNVILWEVKWIDGKRKLTGQPEVESM